MHLSKKQIIGIYFTNINSEKSSEQFSEVESIYQVFLFVLFCF